MEPTNTPSEDKSEPLEGDDVLLGPTLPINKDPRRWLGEIDGEDQVD